MLDDYKKINTQRLYFYAFLFFGKRIYLHLRNYTHYTPFANYAKGV